MGYNATVVVMVDALDQIEKDPNFGKNLSAAVRTMSMNRSELVDIASGNHCNAAHVVEVHHADTTAIVTVGGNLGINQLQTYGWRHNERDEQAKLLRVWAEKLGFDVVAKPAPKREPQYLVVLKGGGDTYVRIVSKAVWDWIHLPYTSDESSYDEKVPADVLTEAATHRMESHFTDGCLDITRGSWENDRAMAAPGAEFQTVKEAREYAKMSGFTFQDEYQGLFY